MKAFYSDHQDFPLPEGHRFPKQKYWLLRRRVVEAGLLSPENLRPAPPAPMTALRMVHDEGYIQRLLRGELRPQEERRIGLPWSPELIQRARSSVGGTTAACRAALADGVGANLSGGTHHAHADHGAGFCIFNDVAVGARMMQSEGPGLGVLVIDCDVHQGDGTAAIFAADPSVYTFSIHGADNFPYRKENSDLDIALPDGTGDNAYIEALKGGLALALGNARPNLAIYLAGADPYLDDRLGRLSLSKSGLAARDRLVLEMCAALALPVAVVMSGGYARRIEDVVDIHFETLRVALETAERISQRKEEPK
jgi:acetoin utilization deacetylase AcuC-like enzyme